MVAAIEFDIAVAAGVEPSEVGKQVVMQISEVLAPHCSMDEITDVLLGAVSACAGLIAVTHGPHIAQKLLAHLSDVAAAAVTAQRAEGRRH